jgi:manganese transport protein
VVQTRAYGQSVRAKREALTFASIDSTVALMFALLVNASILILAAATFNRTGNASIADAHAMLAPLLGSLLAPKLFAIALLCCGLNSTVTATLAGQIVMEGFPRIRLPAWLRRLVTRMFAIIPAAAVTIAYGDEGTGALLILSQVILAFQLPLAIVPLVMFTRDRAKMGALVSPSWLTIVSAVIAAIIIGLNVKMLYDLALG